MNLNTLSMYLYAGLLNLGLSLVLIVWAVAFNACESRIM